jgi:transcriptional regulator with XRE-family HTH domain
MIERQENSPTVAILERIAKALGIEPARLFDEKARSCGLLIYQLLPFRPGAATCGWIRR